MTTNERLEIAKEKIIAIANDDSLPAPFCAYFHKTAQFLNMVIEQYDFVSSGKIRQATMEELAQRNEKLFADILPANYEQSYANPAFAVRCMGLEQGCSLSFLYAELRSTIMYAHEERLDFILPRL
jgi:hypothetical protein